MISHVFPCKPARVIDADTIILLCDLDFYIASRQRFRLKGVAAAKPKDYQSESDPGNRAKKFVLDWFKDHKHENSEDELFAFVVESTKIGRYGRFLGRVSCNKGHSLNDDIVSAGHATVFTKDENGI